MDYHFLSLRVGFKFACSSGIVGLCISRRWRSFEYQRGRRNKLLALRGCGVNTIDEGTKGPYVDRLIKMMYSRKSNAFRDPTPDFLNKSRDYVLELRRAKALSPEPYRS